MYAQNPILNFKEKYMQNVINSYRFGDEGLEKPKFAISLRNLYNYTGDVIRVRRSSDNSEQDFTSLEITDGTLASFAGAGDAFITTFYDQISSNNVVQSVSSKQPKIVSAGVVVLSNGKPATLSDGVDDFMQSPNGVFPNDLTGFTNMLVSQHVSGFTHIGISEGGGYTSSNNWALTRIVSNRLRGDINFNAAYNDFAATNRNISLQYNPSDLLQHLHTYRFEGGVFVGFQKDNEPEVIDSFEISAKQKFDSEIDLFAFDNLGVETSYGSIYFQELQIFDTYILDTSAHKADINSYYNIY